MAEMVLKEMTRLEVKQKEQVVGCILVDELVKDYEREKKDFFKGLHKISYNKLFW